MYSKFKKIIKSIIYKICRYKWLLNLKIKQPKCKICDCNTVRKQGYGRIFLECKNCGYVFSGDYPNFLANIGMGMAGSWGGPEKGGEREDFLVRFLSENFALNSFLLYGVGSTLSFRVLTNHDFNVYGCDVSKSVVKYRQKEFGKHRFFSPDDIEKLKKKFDAVIACEVFEHFVNPMKYVQLIVESLENDGIICGTTNFYDGLSIEDNQKVGYMSLPGHVSYWSEKSMSYLFKTFFGMDLISFEMICPGSLKKDNKYNDLFPNKRVFFLSRNNKVIMKLKEIKERNFILPLDVSNYQIKEYSKNYHDDYTHSN